ncbi:MAG: Ig-like domain-containing protein [Myxococcota bacterium]
MRTLRHGPPLLIALSLWACADQVVGFPVDDRTAPTVVATSPASDATEVALAASLSATFSEAMAPATLSSATFTLRDGATVVPGSVELIGLTAVFAPTSPLDADTVYTATVDGSVTDVAGNAMAADYSWSFTTRVAVDDVAPRVSATIATSGATGVARDAPLTITFSEAMDPATLSVSSITLTHGTTAVPGSVSYSGVTAMFDPDATLDGSTSYTARVTVAATDLAGNPLAQDYVWSFTTGVAPDVTAPEVSSTTPADGASRVAFNAPISATFSEPMNATTLTTTTFTLRQDGALVPGSVFYVGLTAVFTPTDPLESDLPFTATVSRTVTDLAGNAMAADYSWSFTTGTAPDLEAPLVSSTVPVAGAIGVALDTTLSATFSEPMSPATLSTASFELFRGATAIAGSVTYVGVTASFDPTALLDAQTSYTARITTAATDLAGNHLAQDYTWSFTTGVAPDVTAPIVSATSPGSGAAGVTMDSALSATFSEAMAPGTISTLTFTVLDGATPVVGAVSYSGVTAVFHPTPALLPNRTYAATIHSAATDLAGNHLAADYHWSFTTGPVPDTQRPRVTFTIPADDATQTPVGGDIMAVFSEPMDPLTINSASFSVQQGGIAVAGTVSYMNLTATFHPTSPLPTNTTFSATITTAAEDLAGNALAQPYVWNFRTSSTTDATRPRILRVVPADGASDVPLNTVATVTFDEPLDPQSVNAQTFTLKDGLTAVVGSIITVSNVAIFSPDALLQPDTEYTATITNGVTDLAGNHLELTYVWHFTTGTALDATAPTVVLVNPLDLATNVPIDTSIDATFSEDMDPTTLNATTMTVTGPDISNEVLGTVVYDAVNQLVTFQPVVDLMPATTYTVTLTTDVRDLSGVPLEQAVVWSFTTGNEAAALAGPDLGSLVPFAAAAGSGLTNSNSAGITIINGDVALSPNGTCLGDGVPCTLIDPVINGTLYANDAGGVAARAKADLTIAFNDAMGRPPGVVVTDLSGLTLVPGVYTASTALLVATDATVTFDGQGDSNGVWIFQIGSSLTVNNNVNVILKNGAKAKNIFWTAAASSTLGSNVHFQGTILAGASNSVGTGSVVVGRLLCSTGAITLLSNTITRPPL